MIRNRYGNMLLEFCKGNSLFIVNGRVGKDKHIGRFTCRNASVVDYCISSPYFFKSFKDFDILDSSKLYSDGGSHLLVFIIFSTVWSRGSTYHFGYFVKFYQKKNISQ
jgi:hypothetical protein